MAIRTDQYTNSLTVVDTVTANAPLNLIPQGTAAVNIPGTGQNLWPNSSGFTNPTYWSGANASVTGSQADPFGGTSAALVTADGTVNNHSIISAAYTFPLGVTFTESAYFKAGTNNFIQLRTQSAIGMVYTNFNLSTGVIGDTTAVTNSITSVGNGWYRCSITFTPTASANSGFQIYVVTSNTAVQAETNTLTTSYYIFGAQLEIGLTVGTYIPTTTAAVYGTPKLSFAGVAGMGLQSDGSLYVQPAGTGAVQAQATTSTAVGGNARGANAVDWQTNRGAAGQVASGQYAVVAGGSRNQSSGDYSFTGSGFNNSNQAYMGVIAGGQNNTNQGTYSFVGGGQLNSAQGIYTVIGGGWTNTGTGQAAVTTQSATANATTTITLGASNASIKVGQYISGTYISGQTYVAAISGTTLTLSQTASGSGATTLSFFTPHGVVVGGGNNIASGSYSYIGGGGDAGTAANRNVASGDWSVVGGGSKNVASGAGSVIAGGGLEFGSSFGNTASGSSSFVGGGILNTSTSSGSTISGGWQNIANGVLSTVVGGRHGNTRGITGNIVFPACSVPVVDDLGVSQAALLVLGRQTTDATATRLTSDSGAASTINQVIMPNNTAYFFTGEIISGVTGGGNTKGWTIEGVIKRGANAASTALVGTPTVTSSYADAGASTWTIALSADTTNGGLAVTFTGQASTTIRTVAQIRTTEMKF